METMDQEALGEAKGDELVTLARLAKELGWPAAKVQLAMGEAGDRLRVVPGRKVGRVGRSAKLYPLQHTVALLQGSMEASELPSLEADERVPLDRIVAEIGWARNTVKRYMFDAKRLLHVFPDPEDGRRKLYPLQHTLRVLRRQHARVQARRLRAKDEAAGYWSGLAQLKVAAGRLEQLSRELATVARAVRASYEDLRRPPRSEVEIYSLPDAGLILLRPLLVLVSPLRLVYWKAVVPEIPLRGEGQTSEEAVRDLREKLLASRFRLLQNDPTSDTELWNLLNEFIRIRRPRRKPSGGEPRG